MRHDRSAAQAGGEGTSVLETTTASFVELRDLLFSVVYNLLGTVSDTEDVLQDTWLAWASSGREEVVNARAYLLRIAVNKALSRLRSARRSREAYVGPWLPEPLATGTDGPESAERAEAVSMAMLVVLETLTPVERRWRQAGARTACHPGPRQGRPPAGRGRGQVPHGRPRHRLRGGERRTGGAAVHWRQAVRGRGRGPHRTGRPGARGLQRRQPRQADRAGGKRRPHCGDQRGPHQGQPRKHGAGVGTDHRSGVELPADDDPLPDTGQWQGLRFRRDRIAFCARQPPPGLHRHHRVRAPPRPGDLAPDKEATGPDARRPQRATAGSVRDQEFAIPSVQEIRITAREQPCGRHRPRGGNKGHLVLGEDPRVAYWRPHRRQRPAERLERRDAVPRADPRPPAEGFGRRWPVDVQVPTRELKAGVARVGLRRRHRPDRRLPRAFPADQDRAGRRRVPETVGVHAQCTPRLSVAHPRAAEERVEAGGEVFCPLPTLGIVGQRPEREDGQVARGDNEDTEPRSPELDERRILPRERFGPFNARVDR